MDQGSGTAHGPGTDSRPQAGRRSRSSKGVLPQNRRFLGLTWGIGGVLVAGAVVAMSTISCQSSDLLEPGDVAIDVMTAIFVPNATFQDNPIELDGEVVESEWGGPLDTDLPYVQIRMTRDNGAGDPGETSYVSAKAVYTETDLYMLFRWADDSADVMRDAMYFLGGNLAGCDPRRVNPNFWSFADPDEPGASRNREDQIAIAFEMEESGDDLGLYREQGCQVACHLDENPSFGAPEFGKLDIWQWLSTRTNIVRDTYDRNENGIFPPRGKPGYLDDGVADPISGLAPDPGTPAYRANFANEQPVPLYVYRLVDDPLVNPFDGDNCRNEFGDLCVLNNALPRYYIWRERISVTVDRFAACDSINQAPLPAGTDPRTWLFGDAVGGYYYTYPTGSRADVHGKAQYDQNSGVWTLELGRRLNTGDPAHDVIFSNQPDGSVALGSEWVFTVAVFNNSTNAHWGSEPQILRFGPARNTPEVRQP